MCTASGRVGEVDERAVDVEEDGRVRAGNGRPASPPGIRPFRLRAAFIAPIVA